MKASIRPLLLPALAAATITAEAASAEQTTTPDALGFQVGQHMQDLALSRLGGRVRALGVNWQTKDLFPNARPIYRHTNAAQHRTKMEVATNGWTGVLSPGEEAVVAVIYKPALMPVVGSVTGNVEFTTNEPQNPVVELSVHATVKGGAAS